MIPDRDYYADKHGRLTDDPLAYAQQIAIRGCFLDPRVAARYGIINDLIAVNEPAAPRRITSRNQASMKIDRIEDKQEETIGPAAEEPETESASSDQDTTAEEPPVEKQTAPVKKAADQKGAKKQK